MLTEIQAICDGSNGLSQLFRSITAISMVSGSSSENARLVEPGSAEDLFKFIKAIQERPPCALLLRAVDTRPIPGSVRQRAIRAYRSELTVDAGCAFDEIYRAPQHRRWRRKCGDRSWVMGGRYSLKTDQFGLGINNLIQATVQVVLPDGRKVVTVSENEGDNRELFWARLNLSID